MNDIFARNSIRLVIHVFIWAIILIIPMLLVNQWKIGRDFLWFYYVSNIISGLIFYLNYLFLVPYYYFRRKKLRYYFSVLLLLVFFYFVSGISNYLVFRYVSDRHFPSGFDKKLPVWTPPVPKEFGKIFPPRPFLHMQLYNYAIASGFLVFLSVGLRALERQAHIERLQKELEKEKLNSELVFLKTQISPHFFFNTLNNIYSLIGINQEDSRKAVLKLSKLMRYLLYESEQQNIRLSDEIEFMKNYVDLLRLRMNDRVNIKIDFPDRYENINIPPLLFISFIENAFKHGITYRGGSFIDISLESGVEYVEFRCLNSISVKPHGADDHQHGIGLENVKKRLNLLFPGRHDLRISQTEKEFSVQLKLILR